MDEVEPLSTSCWCLKTLMRADPWPSSSAPCASTDVSVDFPLPAPPMTATLTSSGS